MESVVPNHSEAHPRYFSFGGLSNHSPQSVQSPDRDVNPAAVETFASATIESSRPSPSSRNHREANGLVPPAFIFSVAYPAPSILLGHSSPVSRIVELSVEWFRAPGLGDRLSGKTTLSELTAQGASHEGRFLLIAQTDYRSASGEAIARSTCTTLNYLYRDAPRTQRELRKKKLFSSPAPTDEWVIEMSPLDLDNLRVGGILFRSLSKPLTDIHLNAWENAIGPLDVVRPRFSLEGYTQGGDHSFPRHDFSPIDSRSTQAYDNGTMRFAYVSSLITRWAGELGSLKRLRVLIEAPNLVGDTTAYVCRLERFLRCDEGVQASLVLTGTNQLGIRSTRAYAQVLLRTPKASGINGLHMIPVKSKEQHTNSLPEPGAGEPLGSFFRVAGEHPASVALLCGDTTRTYAQLKADVEEGSQVLHFLGVKPGDIIGICIGRSPQLVTTLLSALHLGAAWMVLDPDYPQNRLADMAEHCAVVLCEDDTYAVATSLHERCINLDVAYRGEVCDTPLRSRVAVAGSAIAYVMFTSGSTAKPRAVEITRAALTESIRSMGELGHQQSDICLHTASFAFSACIRQLFVPLSKGAAVVLASTAEARDPVLRSHRMRRHGVTLWDTTPSGVIQTLLSPEEVDVGITMYSKLRLVLLTGERLPWRTVSRLRERYAGSIVNLYSQTETSGSVCAYLMDPAQDLGREGSVAPSGTPLPGMTVLVLEPSTLSRCDPGVMGEIYITSHRLANGYGGNAGETARHFPVDLPGLMGPLVPYRRLWLL